MQLKKYLVTKVSGSLKTQDKFLFVKNLCTLPFFSCVFNKEIPSFILLSISGSRPGREAGYACASMAFARVLEHDATPHLTRCGSRGRKKTESDWWCRR